MPSRKDGKQTLARCSKTASILRIEDMCRFMCDKRPRKAEIIQWCRQTWGLSTQSCLKCYSRALLMLRSDVQEDVNIMRAKLAGFADGVMSDPNASQRDKIRAAHLYKELFGLAAPQQLQVSAAVTSTAQALAQIPWDDVARVQSQLAGVKPPEAVDLRLEAGDVQVLIEDKPLQPTDSSLKP